MIENTWRARRGVARLKRRNTDMADFDMREWDAAMGRLKQETPADKAARALGEGYHLRALEMTEEEWEAAQRGFRAMGSRERLCCWSGATASPKGEAQNVYVSRNKVVYRHLSTMVLEVFGMKPGAEPGTYPTLPKDL